MKVLIYDVVSSKQLSLLRNLSVANQWSLRLPAGEPVHHVMTFDPNDRNYLYLMTSHHVSMQLCTNTFNPDYMNRKLYKTVSSHQCVVIKSYALHSVLITPRGTSQLHFKVELEGTWCSTLLITIIHYCVLVH